MGSLVGMARIGADGVRYYEGGVSSVYFWNLDDGFAGVILLKKGMSSNSESMAQWLIYSQKSRATGPP